MAVRLFILPPTTVFAARINSAAVTYPVSTLTFDTVGTGAFGDIRVGMTLLLGTALQLDDLGRTRVRGAATSTTIPIGRSSRGTRDGELDVSDNMFVTVINEHRVWAKIPYIASDGTINKDNDVAFSDQTINPPPVSNTGPGVAATTSAGIITVQFVGTNSFAVDEAATISTYAWDVKDGTITVGTAASSTITATFPAGFRWINLTVTDSNAKTHTAHCPVYARSAASDTTIPNFEITSHRITPQGQQLSLRIHSSLPATTYPDNTLVMIFDGEPASASDRSHMLFVGYIHTDPARIDAQRTGTLKDITLTCLDVAGKLDTLPGFPQMIQRATTPANWTEMANTNVDRFLVYLLYWHSTALEVADFTWSGTGNTYPFLVLGSDGESLFDQVNRKCKSLIPDHHFTCNTLGQLMVKVDPLLQDTGSRTATVQATLTGADYSDIRYTHTRPPRIHWLRGNAILASTTIVTPVFCVAPGSSPGQGETPQEHGEQLAVDQTALNATTGHRYARLNARQGMFNITLAEGSDKGIEPANMTWVRLTIPAALAAQRGLTLTTERGLVQEINIRYEHARTGLVRSVELTWERETTGTPAATVTPDDVNPIDDNWWDIPDVDLPFDFGLVDGVQNVALIGSDGDLFRTSNFQSSPPTWDWAARDDIGITDVQLYSWVVDPFSPLYRATGTTVNGWIAGKTSIWRIEDIFGVTPTATAVHTFTFDDDDIATGAAKIHFWRTIQASFGRFQETEADNPWVMCVSHYRDATGHVGTWAIRSEDGGQTWSSEVLVTAFYDTLAATTRNRPIGVYLSPKTPGLAYIAAYSATGNPPTADGYVSTDWGATWAAMTSPDIQPGHRLAASIHAPWPTNDDEDLVFHGHVTIGSPIQYRLKRVTGATIEDISPADAGITYGVAKTGFGVRTYDSDRSFVAVAGVGNETSTNHDNDEHAVFVSDDGGDTWTLIEGPINDGFFFGYGGYEVAFSGDNPDVLFIWGGTPGESLVIGYTNDFGASVLDKAGNIFADFYDLEGVPSSILGIAGGDA